MFVGKPAPPEFLIDRNVIVNKLVTDICNPSIQPGFALIGYRRIGKTSILDKVKQELENKGLVVVYFDVKERMADPESFLTDLEAEILQEYRNQISRFQRTKLKLSEAKKLVIQKISDVVGSVEEVGVEVSPDGTITPKIHFGEGKDRKTSDYGKQFRSVFKTANVVAKKSGKRVVLMLDEFQDLVKLNEFAGIRDVISLYRGVLQRRGNVVHVISGSRVHMLRNMLDSKDSPLYQHFMVEDVKDLEVSDALKLFITVFKSRNPEYRPRKNEGKEDGLAACASEVVEIVGGNPFYLTVMAQEWDGKTPPQNIFEALISPPAGTLYIYTNYVLAEDLTTAKGGSMLKRIVREMAVAPSPIEASEIAKRVHKTQNYLQFYLDQLVKFDVIKSAGRGLYVLVDPVISRCLRKNYS
ncbi:MAG: ATP-binding protein [archaeon]|nr:ATP-binding protein [archaeon]